MQASFATILNRIIFIARLVMENDNLTLEDISQRWRDCSVFDGTALTQRQLHRDRSTIEELFGIIIKSRKSEFGNYVYYVTNLRDVKGDWLLRWTMNTLAMAETIAGYSALRHRICFQDYSPDPHLLPVILQAMLENKMVTVTYQRFENEFSKVHSIEPFFIKDYEHRIYLIGRTPKYKDPCVFCLDRILSIQPEDRKFKMPKDLTIDKFFEDCYGVFRPDKMDTELITVRAHGSEMLYLNTRPIHHSQRRLGFLDRSFGSCDFQLYLKPTNDFIGYILSRDGRIEVLKPQWLRRRLQSSLCNTAKLYEDAEADLSVV